MPTRWVVLLGLVAARIAFGFQVPAVTVLAPGLMEGLALDLVSIGTLAGLFTLPGLLLALPGGMLSQQIGERRFLVGCLAAMIAGGALCGFAEGYWTLWFGRLIAGFGAIGINVAMSKIVIDWFVGKEINTAMAIFLSGFLIGIALAMVSLGQFGTPDEWSLGFYVVSMVSIAAFIVFLATYRPASGSNVPTGNKSRLNLNEVSLVSVAGLIWALYNSAFMVSVGFFPLYLVDQGHSAGMAASLVGVGVWVAIFGVPLGGYIADKIRRTDLLITTSVLFWGCGMLLMIPWSHSVLLLFTLMLVTGSVGSLAVGPIVALTSEVLRPETRGPGMGIFYMWLYGGLAVGPIMGGYVSDATGDPAAPIHLFTATLIVTVLTFGVFRLLQATRRQEVG